MTAIVMIHDPTRTALAGRGGASTEYTRALDTGLFTCKPLDESAESEAQTSIEHYEGASRLKF